MRMPPRPSGVATDAPIMTALFATCWFVLTLHFAPNIAVESIA